jgi:hypothetical protein
MRARRKGRSPDDDRRNEPDVISVEELSDHGLTHPDALPKERRQRSIGSPRGSDKAIEERCPSGMRERKPAHLDASAAGLTLANMRTLKAAGLILVGWYLMMPPPNWTKTTLSRRPSVDNASSTSFIRSR